MAKFLKPLILVVAAAASAATFGVSTAHASACSDALIRDWYVDGRIDKTYPVHCYREALKEIPEDQIVYGTLRDDLNRALENVIRDHHGEVTAATPVPPSGGGGGSGSGRGRRFGRSSGRRFLPRPRKEDRAGPRQLRPRAAARPRRPRARLDRGRRDQLRRASLSGAKRGVEPAAVPA